MRFWTDSGRAACEHLVVTRDNPLPISYPRRTVEDGKKVSHSDRPRIHRPCRPQARHLPIRYGDELTVAGRSRHSSELSRHDRRHLARQTCTPDGDGRRHARLPARSQATWDRAEKGIGISGVRPEIPVADFREATTLGGRRTGSERPAATIVAPPTAFDRTFLPACRTSTSCARNPSPDRA